MKNYLQWMIVPALMVAFVIPQGAQAYTTTYQTAATQQQLSYMYALLAQLQAQLNALVASGYSTGYSAPSNSSYVSVQTDSVTDGKADSVKFSGRVTFTRSSDAKVWFEYGPTAVLSYSTLSQEINNGNTNRTYSFQTIAPDLNTNQTYYYRAVAKGQDGSYAEGSIKSFRYEGRNGSSYHNSNNNDTPDVTTSSADNIDSDSATLRGRVDMNQYDNGLAFMVFGEDESSVRAIKNKNRYSDIDTDGDNLRKVLLSSSFDNERTFSANVTGLDSDTDHFFRLCVQYDDENTDETLVCSEVKNFDTDNN